MSGQTLPKYAVLDGFLTEQLADRLLAPAIAGRANFAAAQIREDDGAARVTVQRRAVHWPDLGPFRAPLMDAVKDHFEQLCHATGIAPFSIGGWDIELAAHRDGGIFHEHIDTMTAQNRNVPAGDRMISLVYYLHNRPARFSGGSLAIMPYAGGGDPAKIAPLHNRLVAFPSIARHAVEPVSVPGDAWEDARFSVNCWLLRARD